MTARRHVPRISLDRDELVVSIIEGGKIDVRTWTPTGGIKFPSKNG